MTIVAASEDMMRSSKIMFCEAQDSEARRVEWYPCQDIIWQTKPWSSRLLAQPTRRPKKSWLYYSKIMEKLWFAVLLLPTRFSSNYIQNETNEFILIHMLVCNLNFSFHILWKFCLLVYPIWCFYSTYTLSNLLQNQWQFVLVFGVFF